MSVKMTGAEYLAFINSDWGPGVHWDDTLFELNGEETDDIEDASVKPEDIIKIIAGHMADDAGNLDKSAEAFFRAWRKNATTATLAVTTPKESEAIVREMLSSVSGVKIA